MNNVILDIWLSTKQSFCPCSGFTHQTRLIRDKGDVINDIWLIRGNGAFLQIILFLSSSLTLLVERECTFFRKRAANWGRWLAVVVEGGVRTCDPHVQTPRSYLLDHRLLSYSKLPIGLRQTGLAGAVNHRDLVKSLQKCCLLLSTLLHLGITISENLAPYLTPSFSKSNTQGKLISVCNARVSHTYVGVSPSNRFCPMANAEPE